MVKIHFVAALSFRYLAGLAPVTCLPAAGLAKFPGFNGPVIAAATISTREIWHIALSIYL